MAHVIASRNQIISFDDNDKNTYAVDIYVTKLKAKIEWYIKKWVVLWNDLVFMKWSGYYKMSDTS